MWVNALQILSFWRLRIATSSECNRYGFYNKTCHHKIRYSKHLVVPVQQKLWPVLAIVMWPSLKYNISWHIRSLISSFRPSPSQTSQWDKEMYLNWIKTLIQPEERLLFAGAPFSEQWNCTHTSGSYFYFKSRQAKSNWAITRTCNSAHIDLLPRFLPEH